MKRSSKISDSPQVAVQKDNQTEITQSTMIRNQTSTNVLFIKTKSCDKIPPINVQDVQQHYDCRICLQNSTQIDLPFIKPCQCIGSVMYVHQKCFTEWIKTTLSQKNNRQLKQTANQGMECELCKMKFSITISCEKTCINWERLKEKVKYHKVQFTVLSAFILASIVMLGVVSAMMPADVFNFSLDSKQTAGQKGEKNEAWYNILILTSLFALIAMILVVGYILISEYGFSYRIEFNYKGKLPKTMKGILNE